jgi:single-stranded-DNA-specific exonuclease
MSSRQRAKRPWRRKADSGGAPVRFAVARTESRRKRATIIAVHRCPSPSIAVHRRPSLSIAVHRRPSPSIAVHRRPSPSIAVHRCLSLSIAVHRRRGVLRDVNLLSLSDWIARVPRVEYRVRRADERIIAVLARGLGIRDVTARILIARGIVDLELASRFVAPRLAELRPPEGLSGFDRGVARIVRAVRGDQVIAVFGDYDVDGVTTAALLTSFLRSVGARVEPAVAHRDQGYGFSPQVATALLDRGAQLIIVGDCGTSDLEAIALARQRDVDVVIIDHHTVPAVPADGAAHPAHALINPFCHDSQFPFRGLASVGLAFYVAAAVRTALRAAGHFRGRVEPDVRELLDLVALGTIADLVPMTDENRTLVGHGLRRLSTRSRPGVAALLAELKIGSEIAIDEKLVSWRLAPRLNAPGRLGSALPALAVLLADAEAASECAAVVEAANVQRRSIQDQVMVEALEMIGDADPGPAIVIGKAGWPAGVVGIIAAKLVDRWQRPAFVIGVDAAAAHGRGSARSPSGRDAVNLYQALHGVAQQLERYGGHAAAAGFSVRTDRPDWLDELRSALTGSVAELAHGSAAVARPAALEVDAEVELAQITAQLVREFEQLGPFGQAHAEPRLLVRAAVVVASRRVGDGTHLQLTLGDRTGSERRAIFFRAGERAFEIGQRIDVVFTPKISLWNGRERIDLEVVDAQATALDDVVAGDRSVAELAVVGASLLADPVVNEAGSQR